MFSNLTDKLELAFKRLRGLGKISEKNIRDSMREVRQALLEADVNFKVARDFVRSVQDYCGNAIFLLIDYIFFSHILTPALPGWVTYR